MSVIKHIVVIESDEEKMTRLTGFIQNCRTEFILHTVRDYIEAAELFKNLSPDLVFLNASLPKVDGFQLLETINLQNAKVVMMSDEPMDAVKSFRVGLDDFLLSGYSEERFFSVLDRLLGNPTKNHQFPLNIAVKIGRKERFFAVDDIVYFSSKNHCTYVQFPEKTYSYGESLKSIQDKLDPRNFLRVHRNSLVNRKHIDSWTNSYPMDINLSNGDVVRVSKERRKTVKEFLLRN